MSEIFPHEKAQVEKLTRIINLINHASSNEKETWIAQISVRQPFLLSLYKGWQLDFSEDVCDEILRFLVIVWLYYRDDDCLPTMDVDRFEEMQLHEIKMMKLYEDHSDSPDGDKIIEYSFGRGMRDRALVSYFYGEVLRKDGAFVGVTNYDRSVFLVGIRSLVRCFATSKDHN